MVTANWRKNCPEMPDRKADGTNTAHKRQRDGDQRAAHFVHRSMGRLLRRHAGGDVALDVLDHDDRVIDDDADRQHQAEQRQVVQRYSEREQRW